MNITKGLIFILLVFIITSGAYFQIKRVGPYNLQYQLNEAIVKDNQS